MRSAASGPGKPLSHCGRLAGGRRLGLGVLLAFTVKGIFTTTLMVAALMAAGPEEGHDALLNVHVLVWLAVGIGGYAALRRTHGSGRDSGMSRRDRGKNYKHALASRMGRNTKPVNTN